MTTAAKAPTQCDRILSVLTDGQWHSTAAIHRDAGNMIVHSRIADLRAKGHTIEHRTVQAPTRARASQYRWTDAPEQTSLPPAAPPVTTDDLYPRDAQHRFRLYRVGSGRDRNVVAAAPSPEALGVALVTLGREGEFQGHCFGVLDVLGETGKKWIVNPWDQERT